MLPRPACSSSQMSENLKDEEEDCNTDGTVMGTEKLHLCSWKLELGQTDEN